MKIYGGACHLGREISRVLTESWPGTAGKVGTGRVSELYWVLGTCSRTEPEGRLAVTHIRGARRQSSQTRSHARAGPRVRTGAQAWSCLPEP